MCHLWRELVEIETCEYAAISLGVKLSRLLSLEDGTDIHPKTSVTNKSTLATTQKREELNYIASKIWNLASLDPTAGRALNTAKMLAVWSSTSVTELSPYTVAEKNVSAGHVFACILCLHTQFGCVTLVCAISFMLSFICSVHSFLPSFKKGRRKCLAI